jgi:hypothetical protein
VGMPAEGARARLRLLRRGEKSPAQNFLKSSYAELYITCNYGALCPVDQNIGINNAWFF